MLKYLEPYYRQLVLLLSQFLTFEFTQPQLIQIIIIVLIQTQPISFTYYHMYNPLKQFEFSLDSLLTITRPYLYIADIMTQEILLGISFAFLQIIVTCTTILLIENKNQTITNDSKSLETLVKFICNFFYLFSVVFYYWMIEICLMNINSLYGIILSSITIIEIIIIVTCSDIIFQGGLVLRVSTQLPLNNNLINYIIKPLRVIQIFVFFFMSNYHWTLNIQNVLTLIIQSLHIYQILELKIYAKTTCCFVSLAISSISIILAIECIILQQSPFGNLWLLLSVLLIFSLTSVSKRQQTSLSSSHTHELKYLFSIVESFDGNKQQQKLKMNLILLEHKQLCSKFDCICQKQMNIKQKILQIIEMKLEYLLEQRTSQNDIVALDLTQLLLRRRQFVKAQQVIFRMLYSKDNYQLRNFTISLTTECFFTFLKYQIEGEVLIQMMERMILTNPNNKLIADSLKQFAINESSDQYIQQKLKKLILDKMQFYYSFIEHSNKNQGNVQYPLKVIQDLQQFRIELTERYQRFPTLSNQNILKFYLLEVLNDYIEAFNLHKNKAFDDEKFQLFHDSIYNKLFGYNPAYVAAEINKDLDVIIVRQSKKAIQKFQKIYGSHWKNQNNINLTDCLPEYVAKVHKQLIQQFLDEGTNKYYQQQNLSFLKISDRVMQPIEMMIGLNQSSQQTFSFLIFFYEQLDYRSFLVVNSNCDIINSSDNISSQLFSNSHTSQGLISAKSYGVIYNVIPEFDEMIRSPCTNFFNQIIRLVSNKSNPQKLNDYLTNITITKKFKDEFECFMITLDNIRLNNIRCLSESRLETSIYQKQTTNEKWMILKKMNEDIEENIDKALPYLEIYETSFAKKMDNYQPNDQTQPFESKLYMGELLGEQELTNPVLNNNAKRVFSPKESMNEQFLFKKEVPYQNEFRDYASGSSVTAIKRSKYYKKFEIIYYLCRSTKRSTKIKKINLNYILLLLIILIYASIVNLSFLYFQHLSFIANITGFISDMQLLSVRYDVTEPLESFTVSRYTLINYKEMVGRKAINSTYAAQLQKFPSSCLAGAFDDVKVGMTNVLSRNEINQLQNVSNVTIMLYVGQNNTGGEYVVSTRSLITITLKYQYDFKLSLVDSGGGGFDNPYFYFTYKDYQIIKSTFDDLNVVILNITLERSEQEKKKWLYGLFPFLTINLLITLNIILQYLKHNTEKNQILRYILSLDIGVIDLEKQRLQYLNQLVYQDLDIIKQFTFDIDQVDTQLEKGNLKQKQMYQKRCQGKLTNNRPFTGILFSIFHLGVFITFSIYLYLTFIIYFRKYQNTAVFYQQLSDLGVDIPAIYAQKEILFRLKSKYPFLNSSDINETYHVIDRSLNAVQAYQQQNLQLDSSDYLFDKSLLDFFMGINTGNLCDYQSDDLKVKTTTFCPQVMQGNLLLGLQQTLIYILSSVKIQQQDTKNFTIQPFSTLLELEGSTIITDIIEIMKEKFYNNLLVSAHTLIYNQSLLSAFYLVFEILFALIYFNKVDKQAYKQFLTLKQSVYLFPRYTLLFDDSFYRNFISIIREEDFLE